MTHSLIPILGNAKRWMLAIMALGMAVSMVAQDQMFTQFNAAPTSINPAYVGVSGRARLASLYRTQWAGLPQAFTGFHMAYDRPTLDKKIGYGFLMSNEQAGAGALNRYQFMAQAAYKVRLGHRVDFRPALQMGLGGRSIHVGRLTFMDQILRDFADVTLEQGIGASTNYVDFGSGFMLLSRRFWMGASANHLTTPNVSLNPSLPEKLSILYTCHGGARIQLVRGPKANLQRDVVVSWKYIRQGDRDQLDVGAYYDLSLFTLGVWYRGLPVQRAVDGSMDVDALSFVFGFGTGDLNMGYSYDVTLNRLGALGSAGTHELSMRYMWNVSRKRDPQPPYHPCVEY
jgi:type IX secretion system PorP/SprF family membrane protein